MSDFPNFSNILEEVINGFASVQIPYLKEIEGSTKQRIHNQGKDSDNNPIGSKTKRSGRYSPGYAKKKAKKVGGANLYPINLQYEGDLLKSYTVGTELGKPVLKFQDGTIYPTSSGFDGKPSSLAAIHEERYKAPIYKPSKNQLKDGEEILETELESLLRRKFK